MTQYWRQSQLIKLESILRTTIHWILALLFLSFKYERFSKQSSSTWLPLCCTSAVGRYLKTTLTTTLIPIARKGVPSLFHSFRFNYVKKHFQVRRWYLHRVLHFHNWGWFQNQNDWAGRKDHQTTGNHWKVTHFFGPQLIFLRFGTLQVKRGSGQSLLPTTGEERGASLSIITSGDLLVIAFDICSLFQRGTWHHRGLRCDRPRIL